MLHSVYGEAIITIDKLLLVSAKKSEELLPKWGDQAEFFNKRIALEANTSKNLIFNVEVDKFGICNLPVVDSLQDSLNSDNFNIKIREQVNNDSESQPESASNYSEINSVSNYDAEASNSKQEKNLPLATQNRKKRQLSTLQKSKPCSKRLALWVTRTQFEELNIENQIKDHLKGDAVLIYYKNNGILNGEARGILVEILASCMIQNNINPTLEEFQIVSKKKCELFPTETEVKISLYC